MLQSIILLSSGPATMLTNSERASGLAFNFDDIPLELEPEPDLPFICDIVDANWLQLSPLILVTNELAALVANLSAICWRICACPGNAVAHSVRLAAVTNPMRGSVFKEQNIVQKTSSSRALSRAS